MKTIVTVSDLQEYVLRLGFAEKPGDPGWVVRAQADLCDIMDAIEEAAGVPKGILANYPSYDQPFRVHFHRLEPGYPWLGAFTVVGNKGRQYIYPPRK